jgi:putative flippase GtrA
VDDGAVPQLSARYAALGGEVARFAAVGILSYGLGIGLAAAFHELSAIPQKLAVALSLAIILATNFALARVFIFRAAGSVSGQLVRFMATSATMRVVEYLIFLALLTGLGLNYLLALTAALAASSALKFVLYKLIVFGRASSAA